MRYAEDHAGKTREKILRHAAADIRKHGPDGVSVARVMSAAGLTHGGFYAHFDSKDELVARAMEGMFDQARRRFEKATDGLEGPAALAAFVDSYLTVSHRDHPERGCALAALAGDVPRLKGLVRRTYDIGFAGMVARVESHLPEEHEDRRALALSVISEMIGAVALSRALGDNETSEDLLAAARNAVKARAGLPGGA